MCVWDIYIYIYIHTHTHACECCSKCPNQERAQAELCCGNTHQSFMELEKLMQISLLISMLVRGVWQIPKSL